MRRSMAILIVAALAGVAACTQGRSEDGGPTVSRNYRVGGFEQIEGAGPYDVEVGTGSDPSVAAKGSEKLLERTIVEVKGGKLYIHPEEQKGFFHMGWRHAKA